MARTTAFTLSNLGDGHEASKQLFMAVVGSEVRARCLGVILNPLWFSEVDHNDPFALPPDAELSVEDARQKWGDAH